jgi:hypothetical protein
MHTAAILLFALLAQTSPMNAGPEAKAKAKAMLNEGSAMYQSGNYAGALEKFKEAHATYASPKIWFNIGQATRDLGRFDESMAAFERFLVGASDASPDAIADARKATDELRPKLGQVRIECQTPGAEVNIDGKVVGQSPLLDPIWLLPGRHQITALSTEASPAVETVNVVAGTEILVELKPNSLPVAAPVAAFSPAPAVLGPLKENPYETFSVTQPKIHEQPNGWWLGRKWTWVAAGSTVVFATTATIAGLMMQSKFDDLRSSCGRASPTHVGCSQSAIDSVNSRKNTANVFWGLTAAAALTSGALFYFEGQPVTIVPLAGEVTSLLASVRY